MARTKAEIDLLREGFLKANKYSCKDPLSCSVCMDSAELAFPYPKVTRARTVEIDGLSMSLRDGRLCYGFKGLATLTKWLTEAQLEQLASLLDDDTLRRIADSGKCGPTEEVEVE